MFDSNGNKLSPAQKRRAYMAEHPNAWRWDEFESLSGVQSRGEPAPAPKAPEPKAETELEKLLARLPKEEIERLIAEFPEDEGFIAHAQQAVKEPEPEAGQETLKQEYLQRYASITVTGLPRAIAIRELQQSMKQKGLKSLPEV